MLARLSYMLRLRDLSKQFSVSSSTISSVVTDVILHLQQRFKSFMFWDSSRLTIKALHQYASHVKAAGGGDII
jgi:DNA-directed RNA polymerase specialized sigma54-like protein